MNNSEPFYELVRTIYKLKSGHRFSSRRTLVRNTQVFLKRPGYISKRAIQLVIEDPKKLASVILGRSAIADHRMLDEKHLQTYQAWIKESSKNDREDSQKKETIRPLISLITPVFNPPAWALEELINSVINQSYANFELLLFDFGDNLEVAGVLSKYAKKDKRIKLQTGLENKGISENSNYCFKYTTGEFIGLLDHDDLLEPNTLSECIKVLNDKSGQVDFIYTDKDKITESGVRFDPQFKPDYSPEMLLTANYLTHFDLMRRTIIEKIGGWDPETDGAQDWDLFLRILEVTDRIVHVPKILYHWRTVENSTANNIDVKPYVREAQILTVNNALKRRKYTNAEPMPDRAGQMYIHWKPTSEEVAFFIHGVYGTQKIEKLIDLLIESAGVHKSSPIFYMTLTGDLKKEYIRYLTDRYSSLQVIEYSPGELASKVSRVASNLNKRIKNAVYLTDSLEKVSTESDSWLSQLLGWLSVPDIAVASGRSMYHDTVVDIGSVYNKEQDYFKPLYVGDIHEYNPIGYLQWTRNLLVPSRRMAAFRLDLLKQSNRKQLNNVRDDEFTMILGLTAYENGARVVYDPSVQAQDNANFILMLGNSTTLSEYVVKVLKGKGDPYLHPSVGIMDRGLKLLTQGELEKDYGYHVSILNM